MSANYADISKVQCRQLGGRFSTNSAYSIFLKFSQYCCETSIIQIQQRKVKNIFVDENSKKSL